MIFLSKLKIDEIRKEYRNLKKIIQEENEEQVLRGGPMDSYKEAAAFAVSKQAKEFRASELEKIMNKLKELPDYVPGDQIVIGKWFRIKNRLGEKKYRLVDPVEAEPARNLISSESPLGKSVFMKKKNDRVRFNTDEILILNVE